MKNVYRATLRKPTSLHTFTGIVLGEVFTDVLGHAWRDFTTENGVMFGMVPAEWVEITSEPLSGAEQWEMVQKIIATEKVEA